MNRRIKLVPTAVLLICIMAMLTILRITYIPRFRLLSGAYMEDDDIVLQWTNSGLSYEGILFRPVRLKVGILPKDTNEALLKVCVDEEELYYSIRSECYIPIEKIGYHKVKIIKVSERRDSTLIISDINFDVVEDTLRDSDKVRALFIGDSITCGYGIKATKGDEQYRSCLEDGSKTYAYLISERKGWNSYYVCQRGIGVITDVVGNRDNTIFRLIDESDVRTIKFDNIFINIGTNDINVGTLGVEADLNKFCDSYIELIKYIRELNPDANIFCCYGMMNSSMNYLFSDIIEQYISTSQDCNIVGVEFREIKYEEDEVVLGHPSVKANMRYADELLEVIDEK